MWLLWQDSQRWGVRPSSMMDIQDPYVAYCFDQAVGYLGTSIEGELREASSGKPSKEEHRARMAQERVLRRHFPEVMGPQKFADPSAFIQKP